MRFWMSTALFVLLLAGCQSTSSPQPSPSPLHVITGLQAPEDIEVLDNDRYLLLSQFGGMDGGPGSLALFDRQTEQHSLLYPLEGPLWGGAGDWGDANCPGEPGPAFSPHGIHLRQLGDNQWQLLVVNHGGRESVEFFELRRAANSYQVVWRGCAVAPDDSFLNDVVGLPDGRVLVTHMFNKSLAATPAGQQSALNGELQGWVWQWWQDEGFSVLPGSKLTFPNGIQVDTEGHFAYINLYGASQVVKFDLRQHKVVARAAVPRPDNSSWAPDGSLLVASHTGEDLSDPACESSDSPYCPMSFQIVALNPDNLQGEAIFQHGGAPMGAGTIAVAVDGALYIGSFIGDRLMRAELAP